MGWGGAFFSHTGTFSTIGSKEEFVFSRSRFSWSPCRQNTVEDLVKLARQFDKNMQDRESSEGAPHSLSLRGNAGKAKLRSADKMKDLQRSSSSDGVEAELQALFDRSTQGASGRLSQGSSASSCSQGVKGQPAAALSERSGQTRSVPAARPEAGTSRSDDFEDDWENDELLNDPLLLEITHSPRPIHHKPRTASPTSAESGAGQSCSGVPSAKTRSAHRPSAAHAKPTRGTLQDLCPKLKTTNRSTFKLEPNLHFQAEDPSGPVLTPLQPKPQIPPVGLATAETLRQPDDATASNAGAPGCSQGVPDILWDDGDDDDDDTLLYQVCDSVERIASTQRDQVSSGCGNQRPAGDGAQTCAAAAQIEAGGSSGAHRESPRTFVRSNSLPATGSEAGNYRGWDVPLRGAGKKPQVSQSLPGRHVALGASSLSRDRSGRFRTGNDGATKACAATAKTSHAVFKRNFSDSAVPSNKGATRSLKRSVFKNYFFDFNCIGLKFSKQMFPQ